MNSAFQKYLREHVHFYEEVSPVLEYSLALTLKVVEKPSVVDLGCGDGEFTLKAKEKNGCDEIIGVDADEEELK
jgi:ribosomal protein L11 methylase PrmA